MNTMIATLTVLSLILLQGVVLQTEARKYADRSSKDGDIVVGTVTVDSQGRKTYNNADFY
jgi:hypothetical protein